MKVFQIIVLLLIASTYSFAQNRKLYFLKDNGKEVSIKDSADFIRIIEEPDSGSTNFKVLEYYPNDVKRFIGAASSFEPKLIYEGPCVRYDTLENITRSINYFNGTPQGIAYYYYPNGRIMKTLEYGNEGMSGWVDFVNAKYKIIDYFDSTGVQQVKAGLGYAKEVEGNLIDEGNYVNGIKEGLWKGHYKLQSSVFEEIYAKGIFISGVSISSEGIRTEYRKIEELPEFIGGRKSWAKYISRNTNYPKDARKGHIAGRVILSFVIDKDGILTDVKLLRGIYPSIDVEALRVLRASPKWKPGIQRGVPVRVAYTMPMEFSLSSQ